MDRIYRPLPALSREEIEAMLVSGTLEELIILPLAVGQHYPHWKYAQDVCVQLSAHQEERVRANAALGIAYIARTKGKLEQHIVKPILLKLLQECTQYRWRIVDSLQDINIFMNWQIGEKAIKRFEQTL